VTEAAQLPKGWVLTKLGDLIEPSKEKANPTKEQNTSYIGLEHIEKDTGKLLKFGKSADVRSQKNRFHRGDLLYGKLRPYLNKVHIAEFDGICSTDIIVFPTNSWLSNKFMLYRFLNKDFVKYTNQNMSGVQHPRVDFSSIARFELGLPPISEQNRIASKVEELFSFFDAGVESLRKVQAQLKRYRQAVLKYAFEGKLTEEWRKTHKDQIEPATKLQIEKAKQQRKRRLGDDSKNIADLPKLPENWIWVQLASCSSVVSGYAFKSEDFCKDGDVPVVKIGNIGYSEFVDQGREYLPFAFINQFREYVVEPDTILMTLTRPVTNNTLKICVYPKDARTGLLNQRVAMIKPYEMIVKEFLFANMQSSFFRNQVLEGMSETLQPNLSPITLETFIVPLPPLPEQKEITREIECHFSVSKNVELVLQRSIEQEERLRQSVLKVAFEGKLALQDPSDEPAEKLLERIRAEREKSNRGKTTNRKNAKSEQLELSSYVK